MDRQRWKVIMSSPCNCLPVAIRIGVQYNAPWTGREQFPKERSRVQADACWWSTAAPLSAIEFQR
jgi:hypothetical protein